MLHLAIVYLTVACSQAQIYNVSVASSAGTSSTDSRIIGGSPTTIERYPYTVQVLYFSQLSCGGSLLTERHVLSSAHCFIDASGNAVRPTSYSVRVGSATLHTGGRVHSVSLIVTHERYNIPIRDNDVAVMLLSSAVTLGATVAKATLPDQGYVVPDNSTVIHVGWGWTNMDIPQASSVLNEVAVRKVSFDVCYARYSFLSRLTRETYLVTSSMICAGLLDIGGKDACRGDSGGPLIFNGMVVGITSWGYNCAEARYPGVSARVSNYTNWIIATVARYNSSPPLGSVSLMLLLMSFITTLVTKSC